MEKEENEEDVEKHGEEQVVDTSHDTVQMKTFNVVRIKAKLFLIIYQIVHLIHAKWIVFSTVCGDPGLEAGLPGVAGPTDPTVATYIMRDKGGINCMGVVKVDITIEYP